MLASDLIRRLAQQRQAQGLTQAQVAARMGTSQPYVARLESLASDPRLSSVLRYAVVILGAAALAALIAQLADGEISAR
jgi:predicted transcriptional regulator